MTHGHTIGGKHSDTYTSWYHMIARCNNPNSEHWHRYGGRGITVCARWNKFENFLSDMGTRPPGLTLERKMNDQGYSPDNCLWATRKEQAQNRDHANARKTHCKKGHPLSGDNLRLSKMGTRVCVTCNKIKSSEWHLANKKLNRKFPKVLMEIQVKA